jgi:hypothetical protein
VAGLLPLALAAYLAPIIVPGGGRGGGSIIAMLIVLGVMPTCMRLAQSGFRRQARALQTELDVDWCRYVNARAVRGVLPDGDGQPITVLAPNWRRWWTGFIIADDAGLHFRSKHPKWIPSFTLPRADVLGATCQMKRDFLGFEGGVLSVWTAVGSVEFVVLDFDDRVPQWLSRLIAAA